MKISEGNLQAAAAYSAKEIMDVLDVKWRRGEKYFNTPQEAIQIIIEEAFRNRKEETQEGI